MSSKTLQITNFGLHPLKKKSHESSLAPPEPRHFGQKLAGGILMDHLFLKTNFQIISLSGQIRLSSAKGNKSLLCHVITKAAARAAYYIRVIFIQAVIMPNIR